MPATEAQKASFKKYYEKTRPERLLAMRERAKIRAEQLREKMKEDPVLVEEIRVKTAKKYLLNVKNKNKSMVEALLGRPINDAFKKFLNECVLPMIEKSLVSVHFLEKLDTLASNLEEKSKGTEENAPQTRDGKETKEGADEKSQSASRV
jgi:hypothetical protein